MYRFLHFSNIQGNALRKNGRLGLITMDLTERFLLSDIFVRKCQRLTGRVSVVLRCGVGRGARRLTCLT